MTWFGESARRGSVRQGTHGSRDRSSSCFQKSPPWDSAWQWPPAREGLPSTSPHSLSTNRNRQSFGPGFCRCSSMRYRLDVSRQHAVCSGMEERTAIRRHFGSTRGVPKRFVSCAAASIVLPQYPRRVPRASSAARSVAVLGAVGVMALDDWCVLRGYHTALEGLVEVARRWINGSAERPVVQ